jgi:hypothetical protein
MPFTRRHSNGFHVVIDHHPDIAGSWAIYTLADEGDGFVELTASTLREAKDIADCLAVVSHVDECNEECRQWVTY